jgi:hypothetical protein
VDEVGNSSQEKRPVKTAGKIKAPQPRLRVRGLLDSSKKKQWYNYRLCLFLIVPK